MNLIRSLALLLASAVVATPALAQDRRVPASGAELRLSYAPIVQRVQPAVVNVYAAKTVQNRNPLLDDPIFRRFFGVPGQQPEQMQRSLGSGVMVDPSGLVVTNNHVIEGADQVKVSLADKREFEAEIVLKDSRTDLAVLRLKDGKEKFATLDFANSDELLVGDVVLAIGNPFGVGQTVTHGIVSALARTQVGITDYQFFIQTDAAINPGNSGGALVDMTGKLVGINTAIFSRSGGSQGIGFAIPANMVRVVVASAKSGGKAVKRPWLGAKLQAVTPEIAETLGLKLPNGALVANVAPNSPAARAGLKPSDLIVAIDGQTIDDPNAFDYRFATRPLGGSAQIDVQRAGKTVKLTVPLETAPDTNRDEIVLTGRSPFQGAKVANISPAVADELHLDSQTEGVVVIDRRRRRHGGQRRIPEGRHHPCGQQPEDRQDQRSRQGVESVVQALAHRRGARRPADQRDAGRMSPKQPREADQPLCRGRDGAGRAASAARPAAPALARRRRRPGSHPRSRRRADAHAGDAHAGLAGVLGTARHRQDHGGAAVGGRHRTAFRADFRGVFRRRRPEEGVRCGARPARDGQGHAAVRRRGASLQPRAAGFVSARDGRRHRGAGRRHHGKPVVRTQRRASVAGARAGVSFARCGRDRKTVCACRKGRGRRSCRSMRRRAPCWCGWPMATAAPR